MNGNTSLPSEAPAGPGVIAISHLAWYGIMLAVTVGLFLVINTMGNGLSEPIAVEVARGTSPTVSGRSDVLLSVLVALTAVLIAGRLLGWLFSYVGQPAVIGEVIAGILLGPSLLGWVWPDAAAFILAPRAAPVLGIVAQLGVILYMFIVGLELNGALLRRQAHSLIAISHASIVVPFLLGAGVALFLYPTFAGASASFTSFGLFMGVALAITAFPVLARILTDRKMQGSELGTLALACAAVDDVTAWCLLAFVVGVTQAQVAGSFVVIGLAVVFIAFMLVVVRPLAARFLATLDEERMSFNVMALVFAMLMLAAVTTEAIGVHAIFGAFLFGAVIPHDSAVARSLIRRLEAPVTILLLPAFFALTGMRAEIGLVSSLEQWLLCGLIILLATVGKFGGTYIAARLTGIGPRYAAALGILMNTRGLMGLIVLNIGLDFGVISPTLFAMMVLMAVITTLATAPVLHFIIDIRNPDASFAENPAKVGA